MYAARLLILKINSDLPGAKRGDPEQIPYWAPTLPSGPVIVYCVHGHEVSQNAAKWLIQHGYDARYLAGGIEEWKHGGYPTILKTEGDPS
jgi:rhodanese-related sulfurtransferase